MRALSRMHVNRTPTPTLECPQRVFRKALSHLRITALSCFVVGNEHPKSGHAGQRMASRERLQEEDYHCFAQCASTNNMSVDIPGKTLSGLASPEVSWVSRMGGNAASTFIMCHLARTKSSNLSSKSRLRMVWN